MQRLIALGAATIAVASASFCDASAPGWNLAFQDTFDGSQLDPASWNVHVGSDDSVCRDSCCTTANVVVTNGTLVLVSKQESLPGCQYNYTSASVDTQGKRNWSFNPVFRLCVSAILPGVAEGGAGTGIWPAHWMMPDDSSCWPDHGEIDILEMIDGNGVAHGTYHWNTDWPAKNCTYKDVSQTAQLTMPPDWGRAYHEYAVEHGPGYATFVYDGQVVTNVTGTIVGGARADAPTPTPEFGPWPWYLILNTAIGGSWPGPANGSTVFPTNHTIDWVRVVVRA